MKKFNIMLVAALCLGFAACEDDWDEALPISYDEETSFTIDDVSVSSLLASSIALQDVVDGTDTIQAIQVNSVSNLPDGGELSFVLQISDTEDFETYEELEVTMEDNVGTVLGSDWASAHTTVFGQSQKAKTTYTRFEAYVTIDETGIVRLGSNETYVAEATISVTPLESDIVIEDAYYLLGTINSWSVSDALIFSHSSADVYDDPIFTITVDISESEAASGWWWKVIPQSTYETGDWVSAANAAYGVAENGDDALSGNLIGRTDDEDCGAGCLYTSGALKLTIDLENLTYEFSSAVDYLYTPGDANSWGFGDDCQVLYTSDYENYEGYAYLSTGGFKFTSAADWDHINYGQGDEDGTLSTDGGASNLAPDNTNLHWCTVNTTDLTYTLTEITKIGIIGDATPGAWSTGTDMTATNTQCTIWEVDVTLTSGEFKFWANDGWDVNLGGSTDNLEQGGSNIASPGAGTYHITLDLSSVPYTCTIE